MFTISQRWHDSRDQILRSSYKISKPRVPIFKDAAMATNSQSNYGELFSGWINDDSQKVISQSDERPLSFEGLFKKKEYPKDTVILHAPGRGRNVPSYVPFAVKLETYLRMTKIPYLCAFSRDRSSKHKFPWIEYNDDVVADSEFSIEYLNQKLHINANAGFSDQDLGIARAFQKMFEENTYWVLIQDRWLYDKDLTVLKGAKLSAWSKYLRVSWVKKMSYCQGMGRHKEDEVHHIFECDIKAFSDFLGNKKFMLGDRPCQQDCAVFGQLSQFYWQSFGSKSGQIIKKYKNVCEYCERMKSTFWSDWDDCITEGKS